MGFPDPLTEAEKIRTSACLIIFQGSRGRGEGRHGGGEGGRKGEIEGRKVARSHHMKYFKAAETTSFNFNSVTGKVYF